MIDILMTLVTLMFSYSLLPQIFKSYRGRLVEISWQTLVITFVGGFILSGCFVVLGLYFNAVANLFVALCWLSLFVMKLRYRG